MEQKKTIILRPIRKEQGGKLELVWQGNTMYAHWVPRFPTKETPSLWIFDAKSERLLSPSELQNQSPFPAFPPGRLCAAIYHEQNGIWMAGETSGVTENWTAREYALLRRISLQRQREISSSQSQAPQQPQETANAILENASKEAVEERQAMAATSHMTLVEDTSLCTENEILSTNPMLACEDAQNAQMESPAQTFSSSSVNDGCRELEENAQLPIIQEEENHCSREAEELLDSESGLLEQAKMPCKTAAQYEEETLYSAQTSAILEDIPSEQGSNEVQEQAVQTSAFLSEEPLSVPASTEESPAMAEQWPLGCDLYEKRHFARRPLVVVEETSAEPVPKETHADITDHSHAAFPLPAELASLKSWVWKPVSHDAEQQDISYYLGILRDSEKIVARAVAIEKDSPSLPKTLEGFFPMGNYWIIVQDADGNPLSL